MQIKLPPKGSKWRLPVRIGFLLYVAIMFYVLILSRIEEGQTAGKSADTITISIILFIVGVSLAIIVGVIRSKKQ